MSLFDKVNVAGAKPAGDYAYVLPGRYLVEILACKEIKRRKGGEAFVMEMRVVAVLQDYRDDYPLSPRPNPKGTTASNMLTPGDYFESEMKSLSMAIMGWTDEQASNEQTGLNLDFLNTIVSDDQPWAGIFVEVNATQRVKKGRDADNLKPEDVYTVVRYGRSSWPNHPEKLTDEEIQEAQSA